jgi:ABC-type nickel/cobalt efflux system permease component RcnA
MSAEIGQHKKDHNYNLKSSISFPIFDNENFWTYKEELLLLQFIEQYGFGNWDEISKNLPNRTSDECMQHYHSYYIYGNLGKNTYNSNLKRMLKLPQPSISTVKSEPNHHHHHHHHHNGLYSDDSNDSHHQLISLDYHDYHDNYHDYKETKQILTNDKNSESDYSSELTTTVLLPPLEMSLDEQRVLGYMPLRDDF